MNRKHIKQKVGIVIIIIITAIFIVLSMHRNGIAPTTPASTTTTNSTQKSKTLITQNTQSASLNKNQYSHDDPTSPWVIVNKQRPLPSSYTPANLAGVNGGGQMQPVAADQLKLLVAAATKDGASLKGISAYRSYSKQVSLYNAYVAKDGQAQADTYSARAGHSEHQTGLAIDLGNTDGSCDLDICFANTVGGKWMAAHSYEYGFIIRYASDKTAITGYQYEPWHIRYVGKDLAQQLFASKQTMEEFFGLPAAPNY